VDALVLLSIRQTNKQTNRQTVTLIVMQWSGMAHKDVSVEN